MTTEGPPEGEDVVGLDDVELLDDPAADALARGRDLYTAGRLEEAAAALREGALLAPDEAGLHYWLGRAVARRDPSEARSALERATRLRPGWFAAWRALALHCRAAGDAVSATAALERARRAAPDEDARAWLDREAGASVG